MIAVLRTMGFYLYSLLTVRDLFDTLQDLASATGVIDFILRTTKDEYITIQNY